MGFMIFLIGVLLFAVWRGWRTGLLHQLAGVLGIGFGIVVARIFCPDVSIWLQEHYPSLAEGFLAEYKTRIIAQTLLFGGTYLAFALLTAVLKSAMSLLKVGALNSIAGSAFSLMKWMTVMSIFYNAILAMFPNGALANYCDDGDGNMVEVVMAVAPMLLGTPGPDELLHQRQMEEAKAISVNNCASHSVLYKTYNPKYAFC